MPSLEDAFNRNKSLQVREGENKKILLSLIHHLYSLLEDDFCPSNPSVDVKAKGDFYFRGYRQGAMRCMSDLLDVLETDKFWETTSEGR